LADTPPLILAFDTAAAHCAAALVCGGTVLARRDEAMDRGQAERLLPMLAEMLAEAGHDWSSLDAIAVGTGPGNFTGLRLAVAAARGLAMALDVPAVGVTTFEALAPEHGPGLVTLRDRRDGRFAQAFLDGTPLAPPAPFDREALRALPRDTLCLGEAAAAIAADLGFRAGVEATRADPARLARVALARRGTAPAPAPLYLRPADAMPTSEPLPALLDDA
jgi:tRNA threonylcarbamoyl adenosine modification protein YeaZ